MPAKMARSAPRPSSGLPEMTIAVRTSRLPCKRPRKSRISKTVRESSGKSRFSPCLLAWLTAILLLVRGNSLNHLANLRDRGLVDAASADVGAHKYERLTEHGQPAARALAIGPLILVPHGPLALFCDSAHPGGEVFERAAILRQRGAHGPAARHDQCKHSASYA